jgi:hypothetical protein
VALQPNGGHCLLILRFLDQIQQRTTVDRTPLDERSARRRNVYLTAHIIQNRKTSMPSVGFFLFIVHCDLTIQYHFKLFFLHSISLSLFIIVIVLLICNFIFPARPFMSYATHFLCTYFTVSLMLTYSKPNLSRRAAEDLRLRPRGHWDQ